MARRKILVVGGYGNVGRYVSTTLAEKFPRRVIAAGRSYQKAAKFCSEVKPVISPRRLDLSKSNNEGLKDITIVVSCAEHGNIEFVKRCIQNGIKYIDISADYRYLSRIESLDSEAKKYNSTVLLSVGIAPGLTNLLASYCRSKLDFVEQIDIFIMLGLGDIHGKDAIRWTLENLDASYSVEEFGEKRLVKSFHESKNSIFPSSSRVRKTFRFNFSDQHVITKTLQVNSASTWLCFDSVWITWLVAKLSYLGLSKVTNLKLTQTIITKLAQNIYLGSDQFEIKVEASGITNDNHSLCTASIVGRNEGQITGLIAAKVAEEVLTSKLSTGVLHLEQVFSPVPFIESLSQYGLNFFT